MTLHAGGISVRFGGLQALEDVDVHIDPGSVVSLIGPNGAGKTTLINCLSGFVTPDSGTCAVDDSANVFDLNIAERVAVGIGRTFQTPRVDPEATLRENVLVGLYGRTKARLPGTLLSLPSHRREERVIERLASDLLRRFSLDYHADELAKDTSVWRLRLLEVARAVALDARYVLLDEPAAGLDARAIEDLSEHITRLRTEGLGVLLVEHNFGFVRKVSDRVMVLHNGKVYASGSPDQIAQDSRVVDIYLGGG